MAFSHAYGAYSVEGTLNNWFQTNLTGNGIPAWMPSARVVFDYPETPLINGHSGHAFSVTHLGAPEVIERYQGRHVDGGQTGQKMQGTMDVSCWMDKEQAGGSYPQRLRQMGDMVLYLFASARDVELTNLYTGANAPTGEGALIRLRGAQQQGATEPDPDNPDIVRRRFVVTYEYVERI